MRPSKIFLSLALLTSLALSACGANAPEPTPTRSVAQIQTAAVGTFAAGLTQTAFFQPTATLTPSPIPTNTMLPTLALGILPGVTPTLGGAVATCNRLIYVADVTIPDNTVMAPGQSFTKTWRVQNTGTCAWGAGYKFSLIGGDAMGGQTVTLSTPVAPGATYEISVPMTAPSSGTGNVSGTWRMADAGGVFFGDPLTVIIVLGTGGTPGTVAPTATATGSGGGPTPTGTRAP